MTHIVQYGITFNFFKDKKALTAQEAIEVVEGAAKKVGIAAQHIGCSFDEGKLVPSANFMSQSYLKCEFTGAIENQGIEIKRVAKRKIK